MLVDFGHWSLQPSVSCDKPSSDGYEVENLTSRDSSLQRRGFLAENFIKPPVNITYKFPCKISIHQIFINPVVGAQKSTAIEIYTSSNRIINSWLGDIDSGRNGRRGGLFDSPFFINIGKISSDIPGRLCFTYPRFVATPPYSVDRMCTNGCQMSELRNQRTQCLTAVSQLTIRITRTSGSCIPAVKSVQIFGQPAVSNQREILEKVYKIYLESITPMPKIADKVNTTETKPNTSLETHSGLEIPDEFLDPIMCEIMALPMLLPCGKSLDQSTLEKYIDTEASWGRQPNDPFTGVPFSADSKPIPNNSLKSRIDAFVLQNSNNEKLKSVPRTLGRKHGEIVNKPSQTSLFPSVSSTAHCSTNSNLKRNMDFHEHESELHSKKLKPDSSVLRSTVVSSNGMSENNQNSSQPKLSQSRGGNSHSHHPTSHESQLNTSLSQAMSLLNGLPSFTKRQSIATKCEELRETCVSCHSDLDKSKSVYKLVCSHMICRSCLVRPGSSKQIIHCGKCDNVSPLSQVTRVHV
ncbi:RING finger protein 37-like [Haliotis rubra]|uniref:RING finger protein 37-like n=1 Tax=Haliotis rubra TaxID=36100 RepID=UPI001EE5B87D|nr:RING finger protein 37-like [Haliotis rubra]XP_046576108.1 RING finger protein 37-like [Haliotis rubra]XP_046576109.1 RING finger protein 37-like [Haliotis rubra]